MAKNKRSADTSSTGQIRIIGGEWRRRLLPVADLPGLRPTTDRVRETVFNWLQFDVPGSRCLDMFAGSGALGFEAASRGAKNVIMLEQNPLAVKSLRQAEAILQNAADENYPHPLKIIQTDALKWIDQPADQVFDLVFLDPPFADELLNDCVQKLIRNQWIKQDSLIYIERDKKQTISLPSELNLDKEKSAGQVCFGLYRYCNS